MTAARLAAYFGWRFLAYLMAGWLAGLDMSVGLDCGA